MENDKDSPYTYTGTITIDTSNFSSNMWPSVTHPAYTGAATIPIANGGAAATSYNYTTMAPPKYNSGIIVNGDAEFQGDVKIKGRSIVDTLNAIEQRLSILTPDPKKLAKYEALQKAYAHYKTMEAMCFDDD
jgi:hypothetical protein